MTEQEALVEIARQLKRMNDRAEPKHGRWIWNDLTGYTECSVCGEMTDISPVTGEECLTNYCPNCGADMREVEK